MISVVSNSKVIYGDINFVKSNAILIKKSHPINNACQILFDVIQNSYHTHIHFWMITFWMVQNFANLPKNNFLPDLMNCFGKIVDQRKTLSLVSRGSIVRGPHYQRLWWLKLFSSDKHYTTVPIAGR